jgi:hypothetical protein
MVSLKTLKVGFYLMNFLKNLATTTAVTVATLGAGTLAQTQQAQAFTIVAGDTLQLNGGRAGVTLNAAPFAAKAIDFDNGATNVGPYGSAVVAAGSTGAFAPLLGSIGQIADLSWTEVFVSQSKTTFIQLFNGTLDPGDDVYFDLTAITGGDLFTPSPSSISIAYVNFTGKFVDAVGAVIGDGAATAQFTPAGLNSLLSGGTAQSSWSMTIVAKDQVPTPALIPGIAAVGMGLLRRKKAQAAAA